MDKEWCDACDRLMTKTYTFTCSHEGYDDNVPYERKAEFTLCSDCLMTLLGMIEERRKDE